MLKKIFDFVVDFVNSAFWLLGSVGAGVCGGLFVLYGYQRGWLSFGFDGAISSASGYDVVAVFFFFSIISFVSRCFDDFYTRNHRSPGNFDKS